MISVLFFFSAHIGADDLFARREPLTPQEQHTQDKKTYEDIVKRLQESNSPEMITLGHALQDNPEILIKQPDEKRQWIKVAKIAACTSLALLVCYLCIAHYDMQQNMINMQQKIVNLEENDRLVRILAAQGINKSKDMQQDLDLANLKIKSLYAAADRIYEIFSLSI